MRLRTLALVALMLLPLAPLSNAGAPQVFSWAPYDTFTGVATVAIAAHGTTIAAATAKPTPSPSQVPSPTPPTVPSCDPTAITSCTITPPSTPSTPQPGDLAIIDADSGFAFNGSGPTTPLGRTLAAVSGDGTVIASVGSDAGSGSTDPNNPGTLKLYYQRLGSGTTWKSDSISTLWSAILPTAPVVGLLLSDDGGRAVVAQNVNGQFTVTGFALISSQLLTKFTYSQNGVAYAIAGTRDLSRVIVGSSIPEANNQTHAALYAISFDNGVPISGESAFDRTANGTAFTSVGIAANGARVVAGDARSRVSVFDASVANLVLVTLPGATANVTHVAVSDDGRRVAATSAAGSLLLLDTTTSNPTTLWNATIQGAITALSMNATGGTSIVAVNGTDGGVRAYGDRDATPLWTLPGHPVSAAINANGTLVAYAVDTRVLAARIPRQVQLLYPGNTKLGTDHVIRPLGSAAVGVQVANPGAGLERIAFFVPAGLDLTIATDPPAVVVAPGETQNVTLILTAGRSYAGSHTFNVTARSLSSDASDELTVRLTPQLTSIVSLVLNGTDQIVAAPGVPSQILLGVVNNGTKDAAVGLRARQTVTAGPAWNVTIDPSSMTLAPNSITTVRVTIVPPEDAANGTTDDIFLDLTGPNVTDSAHVTFRINPTVGVSLEVAQGDSSTKFVAPGKVAYYNVTVLNNGSLPRQYLAFFTLGASEGGKSWGVDMDTNAFPLQPGQSRTVPVRIFAPGDATPSDRVSVLVRARTIPVDALNESSVEANLTLYANAIPRVTTTSTTPGGRLVPAPGAPVALACALALALVLRVRRRDP